jgi:hypothetical protein
MEICAGYDMGCMTDINDVIVIRDPGDTKFIAVTEEEK